MLEKVKQSLRTAFDPASAARQRSQISGINLPARLARCDTAYNTLTDLFKSKLYMLDDAERYRNYALGLTLIDVVIDNLTLIQREQTRLPAAGRKAEDPCMPLLRSCRKILELLKISAETSIEMAKNERGIETFAGALAIAKSRLVDDSIGDTEVNLLHSVSELFEILSFPMQKGAEQRRRLLSKEELERYQRAENEFSRHYSTLCTPETASK